MMVGTIVGAVIGLVAGIVGISGAAGTAWVLPIDVVLGALAGLFMAYTTRW
jgi:hypothetical protein